MPLLRERSRSRRTRRAGIGLTPFVFDFQMIEARPMRAMPPVARPTRLSRRAEPQRGGESIALPLIPAIKPSELPVIAPITLIDWLTGSTRPESRSTRAG